MNFVNDTFYFFMNATIIIINAKGKSRRFSFDEKNKGNALFIKTSPLLLKTIYTTCTHAITVIV